MKWEHLNIRSPANPTDAPRGAAGGLEVWKWISAGQNRTKGSEVIKKKIYNRRRDSHRLGIQVGEFLQERTRLNLRAESKSPFGTLMLDSDGLGQRSGL